MNSDGVGTFAEVLVGGCQFGEGRWNGIVAYYERVARLSRKAFGSALVLMLILPSVAEGRCLGTASQSMLGVCLVNSNSGPCREVQRRKWREMMKAKATLPPRQFEEWKRCREQEDRVQAWIGAIACTMMLVLLLAVLIHLPNPQSSKKRINGKKGNRL